LAEQTKGGGPGDDNAFWRFSLDVYAQPGVADECLALQDALDIDVNILLFCAWLGTRAIALGAEDIMAAEDAVARWRDNVVKPLRRARRQTKALTRDEAFRTSIKDVELRAEQIEQAMLFAAASALGGSAAADRADAVARNVRGYIALKSAAAAGKAFSAERLIGASLSLTSSAPNPYRG